MAVITPTRTAQLLPLLAGWALLAAPAAVQAAGRHGAGLTGGSGVAGAAGNPLVQPANLPVSSSGGGITLTTVAAVQTSRALALTGTAPGPDAGRTIEIESASGAGPGPDAWTVVAQAIVAPGGSFATSWHATAPGEVELEATLPASATEAPPTTSTAAASGTTGAAAASGTPVEATAPLTVSVYQSALATFYGPGLYGQRTACGETLRRRTLGVASRTLACGTSVSIMFRNRVIVVPVIDRGPFGNGADWDLTIATARALGMRTTAIVGTLPLSS
jgi:hypothetical protein